MTGQFDIGLLEDGHRLEGDWTLFAAGDFLLDVDREERVFEDRLAGRIERADLAVANLEGPIPGDDAPPAWSDGDVKTSADSPRELAEAGFDLAVLANNHMMDYGPAGLEVTLDACETVGLETCGAGNDREAAVEPARFTVEGTDAAVVNVCEQEFGVARRDEPGTAPAAHRSAIATIRDCNEEADVTVVVSHGGVEYVPIPTDVRRERLRAFVDAGADLVLGHHPHVAQGWEVFDGVPVFPSLGNFVFDRHAHMEDPSRGLAVEVRFLDDQIAGIDLVPTKLDGSVDVLDGEEADGFADYLVESAAVIGDDAAFDAHWQATACDIFFSRVSNWLNGGETPALYTLGEVDSLADHHDRGSAAPTDEDLFRTLNLIRNESHNDLITTAISVATGEVRDRRTDAVEASLAAMNEWTTGRY